MEYPRFQKWKSMGNKGARIFPFVRNEKTLKIEKKRDKSRDVEYGDRKLQKIAGKEKRIGKEYNLSEIFSENLL